MLHSCKLILQAKRIIEEAKISLYGDVAKAVLQMGRSTSGCSAGGRIMTLFTLAHLTFALGSLFADFNGDGLGLGKAKSGTSLT
jgi:hypothetical protein